jgi:TolB-like protein
MMNKLNKIRLFLFGTLSFVCIGNLHAQQAMSLDEVIVQAAKDMEARLSAGAKLAVLNFTSTAEAFSDYVIEELSGALVMNRKVTVIERKSLDLVRKEMNLQLSGDVSDDSAQAIGKQLGAQAIVTGSLTNMGDAYRFRVKVINVETARIEAQFSYNLGNNRQVAFLLKESQQTAPSADSAQEQATPEPSQTAKVYKIGDTGPAGGLVFFDKGGSSGGWRYLEAAPALLEFTAGWGTYSKNVSGTSTAWGTGKQNTEAIIKTLRQSGESNKAADICANFEFGGYTDWFLPSKDELNLMYTNLKDKGLGGFGNGWYWSSSQADSTGAWAKRFSNGSWEYYGFNSGSKGNTHSVRAARAF